jgi:hypothetical protein
MMEVLGHLKKGLLEQQEAHHTPSHGLHKDDTT